VELALRYVELGLRLGRHVDGVVDSYFGPAEIAERVDAEDVRAPDALADDASALRRGLQEADELGPRRRAWLGDQLLGIETFARRLTGEPLAYADEVERCFGLRPRRTPEDVFAAAHEHAWKEQLVLDAGMVEESLVLIPTPQSMVSEGIAEIAWEVVEAATRDDVAAVFADAGVAFDTEQVDAVEEARRPLRFVGLNAALLLHEDGVSEEEAVDYLERWQARPREYAESAVRFLLDPLWRAYAATYSLGGDLARRHVAGSPDRYRRLLTEQTRVADMRPVSSGS
jgi:hypothetical protein